MIELVLLLDGGLAGPTHLTHPRSVGPAPAIKGHVNPAPPPVGPSGRSGSGHVLGHALVNLAQWTDFPVFDSDCGCRRFPPSFLRVGGGGVAWRAFLGSAHNF